MATAKKLPSGNWNVLLFDGKDENKKRVYKSFTAATKKEAEYLAANYALNKKHINSPSDITLKEAYERYIDSKSNVLSPSTVREYKRAMKHDLQELMPLKLRDITQEIIQIAINKEAIDLSPKSVRNIHGLLSAVLSVYMPDMNLHTRLPQKVESDIYIPTEKEIKILLKSVVGTELEKAILLASVGTLRRSEICALEYDDIMDNGVFVNKALVKNSDKKWIVKTTKSTAGKRFIELPEEVVLKLRIVTGKKVVNIKPGTITNSFRTLTERQFGFSFRFHDLRHYSASILHALGIPDMYIMSRGGWGSRSTLNKVYTHIISDEQKKFNSEIISHFKEAIFVPMQDEKQDNKK